jgi:predicted O-methyltransferase YrrM
MINFNNEELEKVKKDALERHIPIIMDDSLEKIVELIKEEKPKRILEIGTAVGYSASCFALSYKDTIVDSIELDEERYNEAKENIKKIGVETRVNLMLGNAVEILPTINNTYDMIFIDANKGKYPIFLEEGIRLSNNNALIIADNILYKGYVLSDYNLHKQRTAVRHLREDIKESETNEHLKTEILKIGDGLAISRVTK